LIERRLFIASITSIALLHCYFVFFQGSNKD
jgi:hypothetical protein